MRRAARRDTTEKPIVKALRQVGAQVLHLTEFDLLVLYRGKLFMLDAKTGKGRTTLTQAALLAKGWPLCFVRDEMEALAAIGVRG